MPESHGGDSLTPTNPHPTLKIMRILDRGTTSIQDTVSIVLFNVLPQVMGTVLHCTAVHYTWSSYAMPLGSFPPRPDHLINTGG